MKRKKAKTKAHLNLNIQISFFSYCSPKKIFYSVSWVIHYTNPAISTYSEPFLIKVMSLFSILFTHYYSVLNVFIFHDINQSWGSNLLLTSNHIIFAHRYPPYPFSTSMTPLHKNSSSSASCFAFFLLWQPIPLIFLLW